MKPNEVLEQVIALLKSAELEAEIYQRFPETRVKTPMKTATILLDVKSGAEDKTSISISVMTPEKEGADACRNLVDKIRELLWNSGFIGYQSLEEGTTLYDEAVRAYRKDTVALFEQSLVTVPITFGRYSITARAGTKLIARRRVVDYFSPTSGDRVQLLNPYARQVTGTAYLTAEQFSDLYTLLESGAQNSVTIANVTFTGVLSELCGNGNTNDPVSFTIQEVPA